MPRRIGSGFVSSLVLVLGIAGVPDAAPLSPEPTRELSVPEILDRALEAQKLNRDSGLDVKFDYELKNVSEKLDDGGEVEETEERLYVSRHIGDVPYERLVEKDGKELTEDDLEEEDEREKEFREKLEKGDWEGGEEDDRIAFDERLISRYDITLDRIDALAGRDCYVLAYVPKDGTLPTERRIDRVLNKSSGSLWIDTESFEVARVEFSLDEKIRIWFGLFGSISEMTGRFERRPVAAGDWMPESLDLYVRGRIFFRTLHRREIIEFGRYTERSSTNDR